MSFAPIACVEDLFDDPQLNQGAGLIETILPDGGKTKLPRLPLELGPHRLDLRLQPPDIGEHTQEILTTLGYSVEDIQELADQGVIARLRDGTATGRYRRGP